MGIMSKANNTLQKIRERNYIDPTEHRLIARELEKHHAIFERVWSMSRIRYTKKVPTAAVFFNRKGELVDFAVNKEFWEKLTFKQKCFVISHECLHIALNHGARSIEHFKHPVKAQIANIAQDLVINHALINKYGYDRDEIDALTLITDGDGNEVKDKNGNSIIARKYCWVDQIFKPEDNVRDDENFEYYFNRIWREFQKNMDEMQKILDQMQTVDDHEKGQQAKGGAPQKNQDGSTPTPGNSQPNGGQPSEEEEKEEGEGEDEGKEEEKEEGEGKEEEKEEGEGKDEGDNQKGGGDIDLDHHDFNYFDPGTDPDLTDDFEPVIDKLNEELTGEEKETLKNFLEENENSDEPKENPDHGPTGVTGGGGRGGSKEAGTTAGTGWTYAKKMEVKKRKWEAIITDWTKKRITETSRDVDQFVFPNRRFASVINNSDLMLPSEYEVWEKFKEEDMIDVWFFQDTSGSCSGYTDRFFNIAESMPQDRFRMRLFCFDTRVYETSLESRELYGFGGTYFHILENRVQEELRDNPDFKYPDAIFVVTDGYGSDIVPDKPENWHWIMTPGHSKENIPKTCKFYDLTKYE
jgi:hypothetical protein